jgi:hypothetical protein
MDTRIPKASFDEQALRKPGWEEGTWIRLGDGQEWCFPKPWLRCFPAKGEDGRIYAAARETFGEDYEDLFDTLLEAAEPYDQVSIQIEIAGMLLARNYELQNRHLRRLLPLEFNPALPNGEAMVAMWDAIKRVLLGYQPPKPSADGSS